ncbi:hypothetical protein BRADI_1g51592v3 [Brachypodium distachyon]|uniref:KIB1-4 beta-propeller domain-containing protein n=1 Tax=Brachypodium distachyon TaxID=15368 RepID=A0A0Q3S429_BRADI|nr:hypothetical protein BRADI_1g51592v3 [Brachypodium distachyon]
MASTSSSMAPSLPPCLVFTNNGGDEQATTTLYAVSDGTHRPCEETMAENLGGGNKRRRCWVTSHGWVLVRDTTTLATFLWNPHDDDKIVLPSLAQCPAHAKCVLSAEPAQPGSGRTTTILLTDAVDPVLWYCHVGGPHASEWVRHEYDIGSLRPLVGYTGSLKKIMNRPASCGGKFYYHRSGDEIGVLEFAPGPTFRNVKMKGVQLVPVGDFMAAASPYFVDIQGKLYVAYIFFHNTDYHTVDDVGVFRVDFKKKKTIRVDGIGDRAIIVGSNRSFGGWCPATTFGLLPNSVYWMSQYDNCLHVCDLEQKTEEVRAPCSGAAASPRQPFWLIPTHP